MTLRSRLLKAAVLGVCVAHPLAVWAADPPATGQLPPLSTSVKRDISPTKVEVAATTPAAQATPGNRQLAATVADTLRKSGTMRHYNIDITVNNGVAELTGTVASPEQREEAVRLVSGVPGVSHVTETLTLQPTTGGIVQAQATDQPTPALPPVAPPILRDVPNFQAPPPSVVPPRELVPIPHEGGPNNVIPEPIPIPQCGMLPPYALGNPVMPNYAWPTYAPYNNYSRVAYPLYYPYCAWPNIGPVYPFPKIPPGWRSVKLEWEDGHWWFSKVACGHDWWRLRYW
jgi:hypothetical protein